jgi:hypothetical protein
VGSPKRARSRKRQTLPKGILHTTAPVPDRTAPGPSNLGVHLDKLNKVPLDPSDAYSLSADNLTVTFNGSYCDGLKNGTYQVVQVFFGCPGEPPPSDIK